MVMMPLAYTGPSCNNSRHERHSGTQEGCHSSSQKLRPANRFARAVVLAAADSTVGNSLRGLTQLNEDDPTLKALVEEFLRGEGTGKAMLCTDNTRKVLTADVSPI